MDRKLCKNSDKRIRMNIDNTDHDKQDQKIKKGEWMMKRLHVCAEIVMSRKMSM